MLSRLQQMLEITSAVILVRRMFKPGAHSIVNEQQNKIEKKTVLTQEELYKAVASFEQSHRKRFRRLAQDNGISRVNFTLLPKKKLKETFYEGVTNECIHDNKQPNDWLVNNELKRI
jgi:hypothetical protein